MYACRSRSFLWLLWALLRRALLRRAAVHLTGLIDHLVVYVCITPRQRTASFIRKDKRNVHFKLLRQKLWLSDVGVARLQYPIRSQLV
jgi:hypothetical protein